MHPPEFVIYFTVSNTEIFPTGVVENIPQNVFHFTELSAIINAALQDNYLIGESQSILQPFILLIYNDFTCCRSFANLMLPNTDVVGIMEQVHPIITYRNKYNQEKSSINFTINDITYGFYFPNYAFTKTLHVASI